MSPPPPLASTGIVVTTTAGAPCRTRSTRPVVRSPTSADSPSGSTAIAPTGARHVATTCGSGSTHPDGTRGAPLSAGSGGGGGSWVGGRAAAGGPPSSPTPSILSRQSWGPPSGNDAQPASNRTASSTAHATAATHHPTRLGIRG